MNRYPLWKYILIVIALLFGVLYTIPNLFGESPAVQVSSGKSTLKIDSSLADRVSQVLQQGNLLTDSVTFENAGAQGKPQARSENHREPLPADPPD